MRRFLVFILLAAAALSAACARQSIDTKPAVEAALRAYLAQRPGLALDKMDMEVKDVQFKGDTAEADVVFRVKDGEGEMAMRYTLRRQGHQWVVERSGQTGASGADMPPGHPPVESAPTPPGKASSQQPALIPRICTARLLSRIVFRDTAPRGRPCGFGPKSE